MATFGTLCDQVIVEDGEVDYSFDPFSAMDVEIPDKELYALTLHRPRVSLKFEELSVAVVQKKGFLRKQQQKQILKNVTGIVKSGKLLAIMGPSGSGKSTLLNLLAGRLSASSNLISSGRITVNGKRRDPGSFKKVCIHLLQNE